MDNNGTSGQYLPVVTIGADGRLQAVTDPSCIPTHTSAVPVEGEEVRRKKFPSPLTEYLQCLLNSDRVWVEKWALFSQSINRSALNQSFSQGLGELIPAFTRLLQANRCLKPLFLNPLFHRIHHFGKNVFLIEKN